MVGKILSFIFICLLMILSPQTKPKVELELWIVYDNKALPGFHADWGFSAYLKVDGKRILFDTGADPNILRENAEKLNLSLNVDLLFLSHVHGDHTGGIEAVNASRLIDWNHPMGEVDKGIYTTGGLGTFIKEQALVIRTKKGLVILTGCAHPGVDNIVKFVSENFNEPIYLVAGGFHLIGAGEQRIKGIVQTFKRFGVKKVMPCHCSGDLARRIFKEAYGDDYIDCAAGVHLRI